MIDEEHRLQKFLDLTYRYLTIRNRSEKEIRDYLTKKKAEPPLIDHIVNLLKEQKFLNDEAFAHAWVAQRARFRPKGKRMLRFELTQKGIDRNIIDTVLTEEHAELPNELTQARNLIKKRVQKLQGQPRQEIYNKVGAFLARRGFDWDVIKKSIDEELEEQS